MASVEYRCLNCGITFTDRARYDRVVKYCSRKCWSMVPRPDKANRRQCIKCHTYFKCKPSKDQKYCSVTCGWLPKTKLLLTCLICSKEFHRSPSAVGKYCSTSCAGKLTPEQELESLKVRYEKFVVKNDEGCWDWIGNKNPNGYGQMSFKRGKPISAHRASWIIHNGPIEKGIHILHICDNPPCTSPTHLQLGTHQQNMRQMAERGRNPKPAGELSSWSKLTNEKVIEIKRLLGEGHKVVDIARKFSVSNTCIGEIKAGRNWRHITIEEIQ